MPERTTRTENNRIKFSLKTVCLLVCVIGLGTLLFILSAGSDHIDNIRPVVPDLDPVVPDLDQRNTHGLKKWPEESPDDAVGGSGIAPASSSSSSSADTILGARCVTSSLARLPRRQGMEVGEIRKNRSVKLLRLTKFQQIHHGIYECLSDSSDTLGGESVRFAFKTECRPAARWHGQQGWPEIVVHHFDRFFFQSDINDAARKTHDEANEKKMKYSYSHGAIGVDVPCAAGLVVHLTQEQINEVHRDHCGLPDSFTAEKQSSASALASSIFLNPVPDPRDSTGGSVLTPLLGVALEWQASHDDSKIPGRKSMKTWLMPPPEPFLAAVSAATKLELGSLSTYEVGAFDNEDLAQISDITVFDYLVENDDREGKNWFVNTDSKSNEKRRVAMDNGWAFVGFKYEQDVCGIDKHNLKCPPILRWATQSATCKVDIFVHNKNTQKKKPKNPTIRFCRFRRRTADRVKLLVESMLLPDRNNQQHVKKVEADAESSSTKSDISGSSSWKDLASRLLHLLKDDMLLALLAETYGGPRVRRTEVLAKHKHHDLNVALWRRFVLSKDHQTERQGTTTQFQCPDRDTTASASSTIDGGGSDGGGATRQLEMDVSDPTQQLLHVLISGIGRRLVALHNHIQECEADYGDAYVYGSTFLGF